MSADADLSGSQLQVATRALTRPSTRSTSAIAGSAARARRATTTAVIGAIYHASRATPSGRIGIGTGIHRGNATAGIRSAHVADQAGATGTHGVGLATDGQSDDEESKK
jgi:hypothetical protein